MTDHDPAIDPVDLYSLTIKAATLAEARGLPKTAIALFALAAALPNDTLPAAVAVEPQPTTYPRRRSAS